MISGQIIKTESKLQQFRTDVLKGLNANPKYIDSKYLYDEAGDKLFQQIMQTSEYYLSATELEIFENRCEEILKIIRKSGLTAGFDLVELGAGDALKSSQLLSCMQRDSLDFSYYPIDISENIIDLLDRELPIKNPGLKIKGIQGEYLEGLKKVRNLSSRPKLLLFLGGNIGNMTPEQAKYFCRELRNYLSKDDLVLIGFDLKKNPWTIFNAYNDQAGITRRFNLNLLQRINQELSGNFNPENFEHYESYDPATGACKSYLISLCDQVVSVENEEITFKEHEHIFTEISQKYTVEQVNDLAAKAGFKPLAEFYDSKKWFTDVIWLCV